MRTECRVKLACYAEVMPTFAFSESKDKAKFMTVKRIIPKLKWVFP